ncbi:gamma-glutamylcyclotransferase [Pikeienuella piscinae]|uniref:glutathione-specific gamma-glutamylcyclotransferase n=1 Tax=Pikeienuella piscinae TaxID=2748098 RepID=A0A7L5BY73_9RHOB|nr:gamma-glutamylcyclotransferase [Pikeienuella piscinae]QIE54844.1 gamma-glutamylcyclotransferase [Pikeienuella piscinae]
MAREPRDLWVFAYGSLMWKPGFDHVERRRARLAGYRRRFCLDSITYRGTAEYPGLVLALDEDPEGACEGIVYRVAAALREETHAYLRARELVTYSYLERFLPVVTDDGAEVDALAYVMDRAHQQYRGGLTPEEQAAVIARAIGPAGSNAEYLDNTVAHLSEMGVDDVELTRLHGLVARLTGASAP